MNNVGRIECKATTSCLLNTILAPDTEILLTCHTTHPKDYKVSLESSKYFANNDSVSHS